ncbi:hypothetical protein [Costertonia aggregata]|uniref:Uncharacterized protein n=1 Tax=Costertonia aggregata TaxID=343403 RepID=A0A7H9AT19_9FLAO|nr:hypothetical protein [Costertonia aggregata]QLG46557.1 hypothetical protein HYG79_14775 [Costertonia aggregata]
MHKTKEIRWFFRTENKKIKAWFESQPFDTHEDRTDHYLELTNKEVGVKTREGKIEVKQRIGTRAKGCLNPNIWGCYDNFIKWSFEVSENDNQFNKIMNFGEPKWCAVKKARNLAQLTQENGITVVKPMSINLANGCQIEYTSLSVENEIWHTCGLEWFGNECLHLDDAIITDIFGTTKLKMNQSKGYAAFLANLKAGQPRRPIENRLFASN